ncbi:DUF2059 domain-containing protein [Phyllobacterium sp. 21LDTY02-6]|jgi:uncharacterized protein|uniref:DUF2059 domain-containing protein n=1 Tax=unclassified Phyllobacterium TaxID=2638441 RepID=UPI0020210DCB|nr:MULTISPECIES: DUF2059 domain-containing protein [unclassified Phyllobacterium]MCO4316180.1 DUF2059 domain-containing protein [Phyllobacterium sp. 21LDTY02-6]MCX8279397.1 DUF2059 domain-containing protein [Phyllobacterium sp. 0TCS1.6C]MCX8292412.1 DUF2059 domain-containing protein [Phyllobacterium sp. 0TCS1.6A]
MTRATGLRRLIAPLSIAIMLGGGLSAYAQDVTPSHLAAARAAVTAIRTTDQFDAILPQVAQQLKAELIQKDPNLESIISSTVDEQALALAARRGDLENEAARAYAVSFTEEELNAITGFYTSPAGKKLLSEGPIVTREVLKAAGIWERGIARDLAQAVAEKVVAAAAATAPAAPEAPAAPKP